MTEPKPAVSYEMYKFYLKVRLKYRYTRESPILETLAELFKQDDDLAKKAYTELKSGRFDKNSAAGSEIKYSMVRDHKSSNYCPGRYVNVALQNVQHKFKFFRADLEEICAPGNCSRTDRRSFNLLIKQADEEAERAREAKKAGKTKR